MSQYASSLGLKLQQLLDRFALVDDPQERLAMILEQTKKNPPFSAAERSDPNRVHGCVSIVWLIGEMRQGSCFFRSDADSLLVRGLVAFQCDFFSGATAAEIISSEIQLLQAL